MKDNGLIRGAAECVRQLENLKPITARAIVPTTPDDKANRADGIWLEVDYHLLRFDVWYRIEGIYIPATEFDAEERPDVVIVRCELYDSVESTSTRCHAKCATTSSRRRASTNGTSRDVRL